MPLLSTIQRKEGVRKWFVRISPKSVMLRWNMAFVRECRQRTAARFLLAAEPKAEPSSPINPMITKYCEAASNGFVRAELPA